MGILTSKVALMTMIALSFQVVTMSPITLKSVRNIFHLLELRVALRHHRGQGLNPHDTAVLDESFLVGVVNLPYPNLYSDGSKA